MARMSSVVRSPISTSSTNVDQYLSGHDCFWIYAADYFQQVVRCRLFCREAISLTIIWKSPERGLDGLRKFLYRGVNEYDGATRCLNYLYYIFVIEIHANSVCETAGAEPEHALSCIERYQAQALIHFVPPPDKILRHTSREQCVVHGWMIVQFSDCILSLGENMPIECRKAGTHGNSSLTAAWWATLLADLTSGGFHWNDQVTFMSSVSAAHLAAHGSRSLYRSAI